MSRRKLDSLSGKEVDDMIKVEVLRKWAKLGEGLLNGLMKEV